MKVLLFMEGGGSSVENKLTETSGDLKYCSCPFGLSVLQHLQWQKIIYIVWLNLKTAPNFGKLWNNVTDSFKFVYNTVFKLVVFVKVYVNYSIVLIVLIFLFL